jgi:hypothetical protein
MAFGPEHQELHNDQQAPSRAAFDMNGYTASRSNAASLRAQYNVAPSQNFQPVFGVPQNGQFNPNAAPSPTNNGRRLSLDEMAQRGLLSRMEMNMAGHNHFGTEEELYAHENKVKERMVLKRLREQQGKHDHGDVAHNTQTPAAGPAHNAPAPGMG